MVAWQEAGQKALKTCTEDQLPDVRRAVSTLMEIAALEPRVSIANPAAYNGPLNQ